MGTEFKECKIRREFYLYRFITLSFKETKLFNKKAFWSMIIELFQTKRFENIISRIYSYILL